ncbi:cytochrome C554 [Aurantimonas sp. Leaf443]|nr:cytochrome C554 [Aurantimonas sp. Leaf443]
MSMKLTLLAAAAGTLAALAVLPATAQDTAPIKERQALMKENGKAAKAAGQMLKGETAFDAATAAQIFASMHATAAKFGTLFPENSKTGGDTEAAPAIWQKPAEFQAAVAKFEADTKAASETKVADLDAFKQAFGKVAQNCKSCHESFRVDK